MEDMDAQVVQSSPKEQATTVKSIFFTSIKRTAVLAIFVFFLDLAFLYSDYDPRSFLILPFALFNPVLLIFNFSDQFAIYFPITVSYLFTILFLLTFFKRKAVESQSCLLSILCVLGICSLIIVHLAQMLIFLSGMAMVGD